MTANLKTTEIVEAIIAAINGASMGFTPKIVQEGDLSYWIERETLPDDLPAIFVQCQSVTLSPATLTADTWSSVYPVRIVLVDTWDLGDNVRDLQQQRAEALAQVFIGGAGDAFDLGAAVAGLQYLQVFPSRIDFDPAESRAISMDERRRVFVVVVNLEVMTESVRV